jgi:hypothetical protein
LRSPKFDPSTNGHRSPGKKEPPPAGGQGVLMVTLVSAMTGFNLMIGAGVGALLALLLGLRGNAVGVPVVLAAAAGGILGVWLGVKVAASFGGATEGRMARKLATAGGLVGLVAAVALASARVITLAPVLAIILPGVGAWLGDRLAARRGI